MRRYGQVLVAGPESQRRLLVKWLRAAGLSAMSARAATDLAGIERGVCVVESGFKFPLQGECVAALAASAGLDVWLSLQCRGNLPGKPDATSLGGTGDQDGAPRCPFFELPSQLPRLIHSARRALAARRSALIGSSAFLINPGAREVLTPSGEAQLTAVQFDLLETLSSHPGEVFSTEELQKTLGRLQTRRLDPSVVRYHVSRLRARLGAAGNSIESVRGCGYRLRADFDD